MSTNLAAHELGSRACDVRIGPSDPNAAAQIGAERSSESSTLIEKELRWRLRPSDSGVTELLTRIAATRWCRR
jgi:hypothetical protein